LFAKRGKFVRGNGFTVGVKESGDIAQISGFACGIITDRMQFQCDQVWKGGRMESDPSSLQRDAARFQSIKGGSIDKKQIDIHGLARDAMGRQRMTADDEQRLRKAPKEIEEGLHFPDSLDGSGAERKP